MKLDFRLRFIRAERTCQSLPELASASTKWNGSQQEGRPHYWIAVPIFDLNKVIDEREDRQSIREHQPEKARGKE
jgi:hypothetical protein